MTLQPNDFRIVETMATYGGSFAQAIAAAARRADPINLAKLKAAFPDLWQEYEEAAVLIQQRDAAKAGA